jgi:hypothetical protein
MHFKSKYQFVILIICLSIPYSSINAIAIDNDQSYKLIFDSEDVSMEISLELELGEHIEFPVSITDENSSLTLIVEINNNSGPLWGVYLEKKLVLENALQEKSFGCCTKYADHVSVYSISHILTPIGSDYLLGFENFLGHPSIATNFTATLLKGEHGEETDIVIQDFGLIRAIGFSSFFIFVGISLTVFFVTRNKNKTDLNDSKNKEPKDE